jgi:DNA-binding HxlR family transcriptional regulator
MNEEKKKNSETDRFQWHCLEHKSPKNCIGECKVQNALILLGKKYLMPIIRILLLHNSLRFNEILEKMNGSPKTITARLRELERYGIVNRKQFNEIPPRVEYSLTEKGKELEDIFERLAKWALDLNI